MLTKEIQHDSCRYSCYIKNKRVYCQKTDKSCYPLPWPEKYPQRKAEYIKTLTPKLQAGYEILYNQVKMGEKETKVLTRFYNFVRPQNFVYGSPRPIPMDVPNVIEVIPVEKIGSKIINSEAVDWNWIDVIVTNRKLNPKILYDYELTPLTAKAQCFFKVSNLVRYGIATDENINRFIRYMTETPDRPSYQNALSDFMNMAQEYFAKRYKTNGKYAATNEVAKDLLKQIGITSKETT